MSRVELWDIKSISTWFWTTTDLLAQPTSLMDIFEPHWLIDIGLFANLALQIYKNI